MTLFSVRSNMSRPEIFVETENIDLRKALQLRHETTDRFAIANRGIGRLDFNLKKVDPDGSDPGLEFDRLYPVSDILGLEDYSRIRGVCFGDSLLYVCSQHQIHVITRDGEEARRLRALENVEYSSIANGEAFLLALIKNNANEYRIDQMDFDGNLLRTIHLPDEIEEISGAVGFNSRDNTIFVDGVDCINEISMDGEFLREIDIQLLGANIESLNGVAWHENDFSNMPLYFVFRGADHSYYLAKKNPDGRETRIVGEMVQDQNAPCFEAAVGLDWNPGTINLAFIQGLGRTGFNVHIYEYGPDARYLTSNLVDGSIQPGEAQDVELTFNSGDFPFGEYSCALRIDHNAGADPIALPVALTISDDAAIDEDEVIVNNFKLHPPYPNPFNSSLNIKYQLDRQGPVELTVFDIHGREIVQFSVENQPKGAHSYAWENVVAGVYFVKLTAGKKSAVRKVVCLP